MVIKIMIKVMISEAKTEMPTVSLLWQRGVTDCCSHIGRCDLQPQYSLPSRQGTPYCWLLAEGEWFSFVYMAAGKLLQWIASCP